ncbi:MAG: hypothetical protein QOK17_1010 [Sphingomonadales bacterium]|jgi:hypothetical protein|nr:hypothetical protein [Sphingomonadales bacterium]
MATLILTGVGTALGGPFGGAIGALLGQAVDGRLFAPNARQGPRLGDLAVQTSTYGSEIPKLFGRMRVAGTVIWATDLHEQRSTSGGKGRPKTVNYSYSASFAVALSARPVLGIGRIWADGKLLRGAAGDFKAPVRFRLWTGGEDQPVDPLIASAESETGSPAYRGLAYAVFEDLDLADFANRIPSLTFEVTADAGAVAIGDIAASLTAGGVAAGVTPALVGYAAGGDSVRLGMEELAQLAGLSLLDDGTTLTLTIPHAAPAPLLADTALGARADGAGGEDEYVRRSESAAPGEVSLAYYDPARDYQTGLQRVKRPGGPAAERRAVAAALAAADAKVLILGRLEALAAARETAKLHLSPAYLGLAAGSLLRVPGRPGLWRVASVTCERLVVTAELVRAAGGIEAPLAAAPGRPIAQPDLQAGATTLILLDLPIPGEENRAGPGLLAAAGGGAGWRAAPLSLSWDGGSSWAEIGATAVPAVIGQILSAPGPAQSALFDSPGSMEVELLSETMWLESRSDAALAAGANLAAVGQELIQFGAAAPIGPRRFRLSRLLRGRRGTEWADGLHLPGEEFVLIDAPTLLRVDVPLASIGSEAALLPAGLGDDGAVPVRLIVTSEALRPPSPVHAYAEPLGEGDILLTWVRRSRLGWDWLSGRDTPLGEEREAYRVTIGSGSAARAFEVEEPRFVSTASDRSAAGLVLPAEARIAQLGTFGPSREAVLILT